MNTAIKLSVIIPTYNSSKTVAACLQSLVDQTYANFETIIIDGLSSDNTLSIAEAYSDQLFSFVSISEKDKGIYDAMNKGINMAKGAWLFFLGSDDTLYSSDVFHNIFQKNYSIVEKSDFIYGNVKWGNTDEIYAGVFTTFRMYKQNICHQSIFYKKPLFEQLGKFNLRYPIYADWHLNCLCFLNNNIVVNYVDEVISNYSLTGTSSSTTDLFEKEKKFFFLEQMKQTNFKNRGQIKLAMLPKGGFINDTRFYVTKYLFSLVQFFYKK